MDGKKIDIAEWLDRRPLGRLQVILLAICTAVAVVDGFDVQVIGYVTPSILQEWRLRPAAMGSVFAGGTIGLLLGAMLFGWLSDRLGRRRTLLVCTALFGLITLGAAFSETVGQLAVLRFLSGLGVGGALPVAVTLVSEYVPSRIRGVATMTLMCGFPIGSMLGGVLSAQLIPAHGWRAVLLAGGVLPLVLVPVMLAWLPESVRYLVLRGGEDDRAAALLRRIERHADIRPGIVFTVAQEPAGQGGIGSLFRDGMAASTILLWATFFMVLLDIGVVMHWLPTVLHEAGFSLPTALLTTTLVQAGGLLAALLLGRLMDRLGTTPVLVTNFLLATAALILLGGAGNSLPATAIAAFLSGATIVGGQSALALVVAAAYPTPMRGTGVGWAYGVGRLGSVIGPVAAGFLLQGGWGRPSFFAAAAAPAFIAAMTLLAYGRARQRSPSPETGPVLVNRHTDARRRA